MDRRHRFVISVRHWHVDVVRVTCKLSFSAEYISEFIVTTFKRSKDRDSNLTCKQTDRKFGGDGSISKQRRRVGYRLKKLLARSPRSWTIKRCKNRA